MINTDENSANVKKLNETLKNEDSVTESTSKKKMDVKSAEEKVQQLIILNAWRHQKEKNKQLEVDVKGLSSQVESLQLQIYALRHLLDGEKARVVHFNSDLRKILTSLEECKHEKHSIEKEKEQLEVRLHVMEDKLARVEMECKNQKNELVTARNEAQTWEKQLEKEREKLSKMKDERKFFIEEEPEETKETTNSSNSRKTSRESRVKIGSSKSGKKNTGRGREDRGVGKVEFGKNVGCIKKLLKETLSLIDEPD